MTSRKTRTPIRDVVTASVHNHMNTASPIYVDTRIMSIENSRADGESIEQEDKTSGSHCGDDQQCYKDEKDGLRRVHQTLPSWSLFRRDHCLTQSVWVQRQRRSASLEANTWMVPRMMKHSRSQRRVRFIRVSAINDMWTEAKDVNLAEV